MAQLYRDVGFAPLKEKLVSFAPVRPDRLKHRYFSKAPCTMLIDEVEAIWSQIAEADGWSALHAKLADIGQMREALDFAASRWVSDPYPDVHP
jgi:hypothetical protein